jgi:hypothetical protein
MFRLLKTEPELKKKQSQNKEDNRKEKKKENIERRKTNPYKLLRV